MALSYIKFFCDFNETVKELTDEDLGCLMRAAFAYAAGEETPELTDVARALFPTLRAQIDRQRAALTEKTNASRKKRGRKEKERSKEKEKREDEEEDEEEDEDEDEEKKEALLLTQTTRGHAHTRAHAREGGAPCAPPTLTEAALYFRDEHGLIEAVKEAGKFVAYNSLRGWDEGKDWRLAADLWAAHIYDFGGIGDGIEQSLIDHYGVGGKRVDKGVCG